MGRRLFAIVLVTVLSLGAFAQAWEPDDRGLDRGITPLADPPVWTDPLDDTSRVYVPPAGLVGIEVSGGDAHLKTGETDGWIASEIITCPLDYRYNLVYIEVDAPGESSVKISMMNASADPTEVGFANETIAGFKLVKSTDLSVYGIGPWSYPKIRIQVNLHASGSDRPRLLSWSLYYVGLEEWRDDFLGTGKMDGYRGINITNSAVEINQSRGRGSEHVIEYEAFPPVFFPEGFNSDWSPLFKSNPGRTGYEDMAQFSIQGLGDAAFNDFNKDGYLEMVCALSSYGGSPIDSKLLWGTGPEKWTTTGSTALKAKGAWAVSLGDFNGDGEVDIAYACSIGVGGAVFLNKGNGDFNYDPDITLATMDQRGLDVGDLNNDGYDDILLKHYQPSEYRCYFGGPNGPDTTVDITFPGGSGGDEPLIVDVDDDGYKDVVTACVINDKIPVYLGGPSGPDTTADIQLGLPYICTRCVIGDVNGDGYKDFVAFGGDNPYMIRIFKGDENGWSDQRIHDISFGSSYTYNLELLDVDLDGYDDIFIGTQSGNFDVYLGGSTWPTNPGISKSGRPASGISIAIPEGTSSGFGGSFTTEAITLPQDKKWDILDLEGTMPLNTSVTLSVLDDTGKPISGYDKLNDWNVDLSNILPSMHRTIKVKVTITSEFNNTTPTLDRLLIKWMDEGEWRDEFYGPSKVDQTLNLEVSDGRLRSTVVKGAGPQLVFSSLRGDEGHTTPSLAFFDAGGLDYLSQEPLPFKARGTSAVSVADVNSDGYLDVAFAVYRTSEDDYDALSPLYLGSPLGMKEAAENKFPTTAATDVLLRDLNEDGYTDVIFAQEQDSGKYTAKSTLFWGGASGWNLTPDLKFATTGAAGVDAADMDDDGRLDLVFACQRDDSGFNIDSMIFLQDAAGFNGTSPSHRLPTLGARAVAIEDLDDDGALDIVLANSFSQGFAEIDSYIYWGKAGGGFEPTTTDLPTKGAMDVKVADLDGDTDLDIVFANYWDNALNREVDSAIYLNDGSGGFGSNPDSSLPTTGACAVTIADLDGTGWKDLVFACKNDGTTFNVTSPVYLGGASGWPTVPDIELPTEGVTDVSAGHLIKFGSAGYLSQAITPESPGNTGTFHTLRYTANLGPSQSGRFQLVDEDTWEVLAEIPMKSGSNEWVVADLFKIKEHPSIRIVAILSGLETGGTLDLDNLWLNWTKRIKRPPEVLDIGVTTPSVYRTNSVDLWVNVSDEYDLVSELVLTLEHRLNGTSGSWERFLVGSLNAQEGGFQTTISPKTGTPTGWYEFRAKVMDTDVMQSEWISFSRVLEVLNNPPSAPEVRITPLNAVTTSTSRHQGRPTGPRI
jgi:hypothetical protein